MPSNRPFRPRHVLAVVAAASVALIGCSDDGGDQGDDGTTSTTAAVQSTLSTMTPDTTGGAGNIPVPGEGDPDDTGGTDTTVSGAVPGQSDDQLDPPGQQPGGQSPEG